MWYHELEPDLHDGRDARAFVWKYALRSSWVTVVYHYAPSTSQPDPKNFKTLVDSTERALANFQGAEPLIFSEPLGVKGAYDLYIDDSAWADRTIQSDFFESIDLDRTYVVHQAVCNSIAFPHLLVDPRPDGDVTQQLWSVYTREFGPFASIHFPQLVSSSLVEEVNYTALNWYERRRAASFVQFVRARTVWTPTSEVTAKATAVRTVAVAHATTLLSLAHSRPLPPHSQPAWHHAADADEIVKFFETNPVQPLEPDPANISELLATMPHFSSALRSVPLTEVCTLTLAPLSDLSNDVAYVYAAYLPAEAGATVRVYNLLDSQATVVNEKVVAATLIIVKSGAL